MVKQFQEKWFPFGVDCASAPVPSAIAILHVMQDEALLDGRETLRYKRMMALNLCDCPDDILISISTLLDPDTLISFICTCGRILNLVQSNVRSITAEWKDSISCRTEFEEFLATQPLPLDDLSVLCYRRVRTLYEDFVDLANDVSQLAGRTPPGWNYAFGDPLPDPLSFAFSLSSSLRFWSLFNLHLITSDGEIMSKLKTKYSETELKGIFHVGKAFFYWVSSTVDAWHEDYECYLRTLTRKLSAQGISLSAFLGLSG